jgi:hypothetical protein
MLQPLDDHAKQRLVDREDILTAIGILSAEGLDVEQMLGEMTKLFYVDLDEFNDIVGMVQPHPHQGISLNF